MSSSSLHCVDNFVTRLKRLQVVGSNQTAMETAQILRMVISNSRWTSADSLIQIIKEVAVKLVRAQPVEFAVGNIIRRVLHLIREEYRTSTSEAASPIFSREAPISEFNQFSRSSNSSNASLSSSSGLRMGGDSAMFNMLAEAVVSPIDFSQQCYQLKPIFIQCVNDIVEDLENVASSLAQQSVDYINSNEIIMTIGRSGTVEKFLLHAARKRSFQVIVAEGSPNCHGRRLASTLAEAGIETMFITDASIYSLMSRVTKVVIGCHAVTANGGLIGPSGSQLIADAAKQYSTPLCVVTGLYKLTPIYPENHDSFNLLGNPAAILPYADGDLLEKVDVVNPQFDYVAPSLISLFITNTGGHPPSYVYRLMRETYDLEDADLASFSI